MYNKIYYVINSCKIKRNLKFLLIKKIFIKIKEFKSSYLLKLILESLKIVLWIFLIFSQYWWKNSKWFRKQTFLIFFLQKNDIKNIIINLLKIICNDLIKNILLCSLIYDFFIKGEEYGIISRSIKIFKIVNVFLLISCTSLNVEHDQFGKIFRIYQSLNKNAELKGIFNYKTGITKIVLYTRFRNHSITEQTPLLLSDGTRIEGQVSHKRDNNHFFGNWINYSSFVLSKSLLEKMIKEEDASYKNDEIKIRIGLEELSLKKHKILDFLVMVESIENKDYKNWFL